MTKTKITTYGELQPGQWIDGQMEGDCLEVAAVVPTKDSPGCVRVLYANGDVTKVRADSGVPLATPEQIAEAQKAATRLATVKGLCELANLLTTRSVPLPTYGLDVTAYLDSEADVQAWADLTGGTVTRNSKHVSATWMYPAGVERHNALLEVRVTARAEETAAGESDTSADAVSEGASSMAPARAAAAPSAVGGEPAADGVTPTESVPVPGPYQMQILRWCGRHRGRTQDEAIAADEREAYELDAVERIDPQRQRRELADDESVMVRTRTGYASDLDD